VILSLLSREDRDWVLENARLLRTALLEVIDARRPLSQQPHVCNQYGQVLPRSRVIADTFLRSAAFDFSAQSISAYLSGWQENHRLAMGEIWALKPAIELVLLQELAGLIQPLKNSKTPPVRATSSTTMPQVITALQRVGEEDWETLFEQVSLVHQVLSQDPAGVYSRMDDRSRKMYRGVVAELASHSERDEVEVAQAAVALAQSRQSPQTADSLIQERQRHVGYYLLDAGLPFLHHGIGYQATWGRRLQDSVGRFPNGFYLTGVQILTALIMLSAVIGLPHVGPVVAILCLLLVPASQAAVEIMNDLVTSWLPARLLPKLDFSLGIPDPFKTLVAVPCLLSNESQVTELVRSLEVRYLANRDPNLYFALLTDGPDSNQPFDEVEALAEHCSHLIAELNRKYAASGTSFFLLHRHRVFNPCEEVWMGWERKRGKLLDLNKLLRGAEDRFPVKVGSLSVLPHIRFVITLDCDTQLPRDAARRLIGAMAHPLNRAIVDPISNTVVSGYGILQPRVGVSVHSACRSRLASAYSGESGFDIYTRAVSDVYQDLYGEGIFTGKGIYEVDVFRRVLDERFPCNTLLSHDLIEGAYTRAALVSDIELIDDYPSHFSAYSRRKHRWARGDWQIMQWLFPLVPDYHGRPVANPISLISRWKIFDNLRRSLLDPALFFLVVAGWLFLPGLPWYWTAATIALLLAPVYVQAIVALCRVTSLRQFRSALNATGATLMRRHFHVLLTVTFMAHQALVMIDAIVRTMIRHRITRRRLLQWETAAEAESRVAKKTLVDACLCWTPWIALGISLALASYRPQQFLVAVPLLLLWGASPVIAAWLSRKPQTSARVKTRDREFLRGAALRTWRYFAENSGPADHWLIPDNVQEFPDAVAHRASPTNLGLLLNARQAALAFGYLTLPEFASLTRSTLDAVSRLPKYRGHLFNWYDTRTLQPLDPLFISTVDSGNLAASLWALKQGCLELADQSIFPASLWAGIIDHVRILDELDQTRTAALFRMTQEFDRDGWKWLIGLDKVECEVQELLTSFDADVRWWACELVNRIAAVRRLADAVAPCVRMLSPAVLRDLAGDPKTYLDSLTLARAPAIGTELHAKLRSGYLDGVRNAMEQASARATALRNDLLELASVAGSLVEEMDFHFLYNHRKKLLSVGYDVPGRNLDRACYDLLASEARTAAFVAVAKGDIPQESWFRLGRCHTNYRGRKVLLSWSGTMFEYLMPSLWMKTSSQTILTQSAHEAVSAQRLHSRTRHTPWGISESAHVARDAHGFYQYCAFGLPGLALKRANTQPHVIAPYATFLALATHPAAAAGNIRRMSSLGWIGKYGFYEAVDFRWPSGGHPDGMIVKSWMAHHQAMSLMAAANLVLGAPFQRYFHSEPQVMATELLLHERIPAGLKVESEPEPEFAAEALTCQELRGRVPVQQVM
jgi:hypothetical protein